MVLVINNFIWLGTVKALKYSVYFGLCLVENAGFDVRYCGISYHHSSKIQLQSLLDILLEFLRIVLSEISFFGFAGWDFLLWDVVYERTLGENCSSQWDCYFFLNWNSSDHQWDFPSFRKSFSFEWHFHSIEVTVVLNEKFIEPDRD